MIRFVIPSIYMHAHQECVCECRTWKIGGFNGKKQTPQSRASASATVRSGTHGGAMAEAELEDSRFVSRPRPAGVVGQGSHPADIRDPVAIASAVSLGAAHVQFVEPLVAGLGSFLHSSPHQSPN
jgi:hypothetical protein